MFDILEWTEPNSVKEEEKVISSHCIFSPLAFHELKVHRKVVLSGALTRPDFRTRPSKRSIMKTSSPGVMPSDFC